MSDPIVFVPGLLCTEALFAPQIVAYADRPIMVANHRDHDSIGDIAASILEQAPERFSLIGLSMGGYISMEIMRLAPERVGKLALLDTNARPDTEDQTKRRKFLIDLTRKKGFTKIPHLLFPGFVHENREEDEHLKSAVVEMAHETGPDAFIRQKTAIINRIDSRPSLANIACPTLVLVGDGDQLTPPSVSREIHEHIPGSDLSIIENCGHLSTLEAPDVVTGVIRDFLNS
ncbi:MAG: alpha/beta fold hydrolase [Roseibium sp.]|uniref:alpha/beta fold hydrolase n=1 Tax=Roseibium sp. TaxID=1936156 RepID=UPI001B283677|nr:alpha/beta fold hydrolase [Roseibium sp.]MBO6891986.1 alpha/beta fold hydrolase [Roseibium sp.]MBO6933223.1 alpha/beta fold hydrolase [Roseibium sp.]